MHYRTFLISFISGCATLILLSVALFFLGAGVTQKMTGNGWTTNLIKTKTALIEQTRGPKAVILSGSNGLFGISANQLADIASIPVINAASHAGLAWSYLDYYALSRLEKGDFAILPLEWAYYSQHKEDLNTLTVSIAHASGLGFFRSLSTRGKLEYLQLLSIKFLGQQIRDRFRLTTKKNAFKYWEFSLLSSGDIDLASAGSEPAGVQAENGDVSAAITMTDFLCSSIKAATARGVRTIVTQPNYYADPQHVAAFKVIMQKVSDYVEGCGASFVSVPSQGLQSLENMHDTRFHLTARGQFLRTEELARSLCAAGMPCKGTVP